ncbi:MAG TPA: ABC transporter permease [Thermoanaerobaculia bacterium]|nr:ABC transporter permease [Thermoanaerobaculia bacterium]
MGQVPQHQPHPGAERVTVIEPPAGWRAVDWPELWEYRELLWVMTTRDVKVRYKQTVLGAGWAVIRPLLTMLMFTLIFGKFAKMPSDGFPYPIFVYSALLPWTFFSSAVGASAGSLVGNAPMLSKVYFPRLIIPLSSVGGALVDLLVSTGLLLLMMIWYGVGWTAQLALVLPLVVLLVLVAAGIGTMLSAVTVSYRDFSHITPFLLQIWMYVTPVVFPLSVVPARWRSLLYLNPMTGIVEGFRSAFLGKPFDFVAVASSVVWAVVLLTAAVAYFERVERRFADII